MENKDHTLNDELNMENSKSDMEEESVEKEVQKANKETDEDLEFLKAQIRYKKMIQNKKKEEKQEDYSYIKRFKINSYIETVAGVIALVLGIVTKNYLTDCLGIALICFGYLFRNIAKHGEYKRDKENNKK